MCMKVSAPKRDPAVDKQIARQEALAQEQRKLAARETAEQKESDIQDEIESQSGLTGTTASRRASRGRRSLISSDIGGIGYYSRFK